MIKKGDYVKCYLVSSALVEGNVEEYNDNLIKLSSKEDRTYDYRTMLMNENRLYAIDLDLICLKYTNNKPVYVASLELTRINDYHNGKPPIDYFIKVITRYREQGQKKLSIDLASRLECPYIITAFSSDLMHFYLYNLTKDNNKWYYQNRPKHLEWHYKIRDMKVPSDVYEQNKMKPIQSSFSM